MSQNRSIDFLKTKKLLGELHLVTRNLGVVNLVVNREEGDWPK